MQRNVKFAIIVGFTIQAWGQVVVPLVLDQEISLNLPNGDLYLAVDFLNAPHGTVVFNEPAEQIWRIGSQTVLMLGSTGTELPTEWSQRKTAWVRLYLDGEALSDDAIALAPFRDGIKTQQPAAALQKSLGKVLSQRMGSINAAYLSQIVNYLAGNATQLDINADSYQIQGTTVVNSDGEWVGNVGGNLASQLANLQSQLNTISANQTLIETNITNLNEGQTQLNIGFSNLNNGLTNLNNSVTVLQNKTAAMSVDGNEVFFTGVNLNIRSGSGSTNGTVNGVGNLIVGYNEFTAGLYRNGSHNLIVGPYHSYYSYGGFIAGYSNATTGIYASVSGGRQNEASGKYSAVTGGRENFTGSENSTILGGRGNGTLGADAVVQGGRSNTAYSSYSAVSGGYNRSANAIYSWVAGTLNESQKRKDD